MRVALGIEYEGTPYCGWQKQPGLETVQSTLEEALSKVADQPIEVTAAGRTDTGVHALGQVVHFETPAERNMRAWVYGGNNYLPKHIVVHWAKEVNDDFHARFSATARSYRYLIYSSPIRPAVMHNGLTWYYQNLDVAKMAEATQYWLGDNDFSAFRSSECHAKSPFREVSHISIAQHGQLIVFDITANAFLHHMVRNMVGTLLAIGSGQQEVEWAEEVLQSRRRALAGITAPPYGLYLMRVTYPEAFSLPVLKPLGPTLLR